MAFVPTGLSWVEPLAAAAGIAKSAKEVVFLHSSLKTGYSGRYSLLAWDAEEIFSGPNINALAQPAGQTLLLGYIGYETAHALEAVPATQPSFIPLPVYHLAQFREVLRFDHETHTVEAWNATSLKALSQTHEASPTPPVSSLGSNMDKQRYLNIVKETLSRISEGDFYQANVTRKFFGAFASPPDDFSLYRQLINASPAPYSAFLRLGGTSLLSSSPELFLKIENGTVTTRPIKGTAPKKQRESALAESEKDRAENLMIVDLMRHDLSRVSLPGTVEVKALFATDSFSTLHHLSSVIEGRLQPGKTPLDALKAAFPPGSMTGAPKIAAMKFLAEQEILDRGAYSGALGWMSRDAAEWSVVIRTLVLQGRKFEFQVGGGITAGSGPHSEWQETLTKARGLAMALGIGMETLESL